jgi:sulfate transport system substrate-binding protein
MNKAASVVGLVLIASMVLQLGCLDLGGTDDKSTITLYGFSVKGEVMRQKVFPAFQRSWKERTGEEVRFASQFAGSGKVTNEVIAGAEAEVMVLSTEWDVIQLKKGCLTDMELSSLPWNGTVSTTPWVILVRDGNPKGISDFGDLGKKGVELVHADPLTSGGACWSVFAIYGSELRRTTEVEGAPNTTAAEALLRNVMKNVISWQSSARAALSQFVLGYGDALITYENEALLAIEQGHGLEVVYPPSTVLSEHKAVIVDRHVSTSERELVEAFVDYLFTEDVQRWMTEFDFRSMEAALNGAFVEVEDPFLISYLGGWERAHPELISELFASIKGD